MINQYRAIKTENNEVNPIRYTKENDDPSFTSGFVDVNAPYVLYEVNHGEIVENVKYMTG